MKYLLFFLLFFPLEKSLNAQIFKGTIRYANDFELLDRVMVKDINTGTFTLSNSNGYFELRTKMGNTIEFYKDGFQTQKKTINNQHLQNSQAILLKPKEQLLEEVIIVGRTKYQIDSINRRELYKMPLSQQKEKAEFVITPTSLMIANPISSWMQYLAPKTRKTFKFQKRFKQWEDEKYIASRYSLEKAGRLTLLKDDDLANFYNAYPIAMEQLRMLKEEALNQWILTNFKEWQSKSEGEKLDLLYSQLRN